jgi:hypothetical protein
MPPHKITNNLLNKKSKKVNAKTKKVNAKSKNTEQVVCYTGIGSDNKNPTYTQTEFVAIADKSFKADCIEYQVSKKCKPCAASKALINNFMKNASPESKYKMPPKLEAKYNKLYKKCKTCKLNKCSFDEYIEYSGAELGKC